jgi:hypothetical protein
MKSLAERFESKTIPEPNSGCLLWLGTVSSRGYAKIWIGKKTISASHLAFNLAGKSVPAGMLACHHCDNPVCVNIDHLFIGTHKDNSDDMFAKGRESIIGLRKGVPEKINRTSEEKRKIAREMLARGAEPKTAAAVIGVHPDTVRRWIRGIHA